ncbi:MAG: hypothetical protein QXU61_06155, partial [Archaeoglobaceae archaeon]
MIKDRREEESMKQKIYRKICEIPLRDFQPIPQLVTESHIPEKPYCSVIDAHNHLTIGEYKFGKHKRLRPKIDWNHETLISIMNSAGVEKIIDLTPFYGEKLKVVLDFHRPYKDRFVVFGSIDFTKIDSHKFASETRRMIIQNF